MKERRELRKPYSTEDFRLEFGSADRRFVFNNFIDYFPFENALYRQAYKDPSLPKVKRKIMDALDDYCRKKNFNFDEFNRYNFLEEKEKEVTEIYCFLRSMGYSHQQLIT